MSFYVYLHQLSHWQGLKYCDILFVGLWIVVVKTGKNLLCHIAFFLDYTLDLSFHPPTQMIVHSVWT